jgi:glycine oxidase
VIVGAGVIGAAIAYELSRQTRLHVMVVERGTPGCEASNAAAGTLPVASSRARGGAVFALRRASARLFPDLVARLEEESAMHLGYRCDGTLAVALSDAEAEALDDLVPHRLTQGFAAQRLDRDAVLAAEPAINPEVRCGAFFADDTRIESPPLVAALVRAAQRRGVGFRLGTDIRAAQVERASLRLFLHDGELWAPAVVVAAGAWSAPLLAGCGVKVPVRPARGEMLALRPARWSLRVPVSAQGGYLVPRPNGEVFVGSTMSFAGFDRRVTPTGVAMLRDLAAAAVPQARAARLLRTWAGLRPCSTIRRPLITRLPGAENVVLATGHHRNGILLAPITAKLVVELITGVPPSIPLHPFGYRKH